MKRFRYVVATVLIFSFLSGISAAKEEDPKKWTVEDVLKQESAGSFDISPDGKWVVWVKTRPDKDANRRVSDLYLTSLVDSTEIQLTRGKYSDRSPKWSPDGKWIAFLSARGEGKERTTQIWLINPRGGEPWKLTSVEKGVRSFAWRDAKHIIFTARENTYFYEQELKRKKDDAIVVGDQEHFYPVRLFQICIREKKVKRLTMNTGRIQEFAVSPDGRWVVTSEAQSVHYGYDHRIPPRQYLYDLKEKTREEIFTEKYMKPSRFVWTLDGKGFFCTQPLASNPEDDYVSVPTLYYFDLASRKYEKVPLNWKWELGFFGYYITKNGLLASLANGPWNKLAFYFKDGKNWKRQWLKDEKEKNIFINAVGRDGKTVIYTYTTASTPPRIYVATLNNFQLTGKREIIRLNKWMDKKYIAKSEVISWKGARGDKVDGILYYPHNYEPGKRYPLIASIHGGPSGVDVDAFRESWSSYPNVLASRGAFVLKVNYHGSGNYGLEWVESIKGHYYEYEVPDILKGIDYVIKRGLVDPEKLGIMGWSNGAILTIQCVIETDRFKVCAPGAGDVNWTSDYGNCAFGAAFDNAYFGGPPWERPQYYIKKSPLFKMQKVKTPTIIFFGTEDTNVPTEQGWEHYRALQQIGKAPVRFILFPGEPHGLRKLTHQRRKMEEELAWFDKYLFKTYRKPNEAFKKDSPLAIALKKADAKKVNGRYGELINGILAPEVVFFDSLWVGRFEVTRAQYAAFDPEYRYEPGTENYPANNIPYEKARAYCEWLTKKTGKTFRLPTEKEMRKLAARGRSNARHENVLDYWAGYELTPDDAALLQPKVKELERKGSLLMPVGSFRPVGKSVSVFDLGGNVAEWCTAKDGTGKIVGLSAISPSDSKAPYSPPPMRYVGFRIIQEK
jgi:dipeptidyl aminopeptidase/acylaminoacyl peptidase